MMTPKVLTKVLNSVRRILHGVPVIAMLGLLGLIGILVAQSAFASTPGHHVPAQAATHASAPTSIAPDEHPATLQPSDHTPHQEPSNTIPVSFVKGKVSRQTGSYILGPGDAINIEIKDLKQYDQRITVRPDGFAGVHPFGQFEIAGLDIAGFEHWLEKKFEYYLLRPEITVNVAEMRPATDLCDRCRAPTGRLSVYSARPEQHHQSQPAARKSRNHPDQRPQAGQRHHLVF